MAFVARTAARLFAASAPVNSSIRVARSAAGPAQSTSPIRFYQFSDRIEIQNPGGLYGEASPENFPRVNTYRNPIIAEAMHTLGYVNRFGRGIARARRALADNGSPEPAFDYHTSHFLAIIPRHPLR